MAGTSIFAATPSIFESLVFKLIFIVKPLPGSVAGGGERKKWDETERKSASEASQVVEWGGEKAAELLNPHPSPDSLARFTGRFFSLFPSLRSLVPGYYNILCITNKLNRIE